MAKLTGAIAAALTPLTDGGRRVDRDAIGPLASFLAEGGVDGALVAGTTGEGLLLTVEERKSLAAAFVDARPDGFLVAVHAGAQTSSDTAVLAAHAAEVGADAVAVIAPPFFPLDEEAMYRHFVLAAAACEPLPFYVYEFAARSGYAIPIPAIERLREAAPNLAGLKVSDRPFDQVRPYLLDGLDVFIGSEPIVLEGLDAGAVGAVSGLATAWPELVSWLVHRRDPSAHERVVALRQQLAILPFHAALKRVVADRGVLPATDVRPPLRPLTNDELARVRELA